ncbi:MAG: nucleotidyltransferase domain-containing protein [Luteolibacter sp.]|jgi:predicted nucleotidyltransferase|nr:nucleotidyltransferase domain-containing protein [Luteolibacter sp.]
MNSPESIIRTIRSLEGELRSAGVAKLWLFGSAARGEADARDLDFLVEFTTPPTLTGFMGLKFFLEEQLHMPVDLHTRSSCPDRFMRRIQSDLLHVA